jgi:hypothetical protein
MIAELQRLITFQESFFFGLLQGIPQPLFVDGPDAGRRYPKLDPAVLLLKVKSLIE